MDYPVCDICFENVKSMCRTNCNHELCRSCMNGLKSKSCPFCRRDNFLYVINIYDLEFFIKTLIKDKFEGFYDIDYLLHKTVILFVDEVIKIGTIYNFNCNDLHNIIKKFTDKENMVLFLIAYKMGFIKKIKNIVGQRNILKIETQLIAKLIHNAGLISINDLPFKKLVSHDITFIIEKILYDHKTYNIVQHDDLLISNYLKKNDPLKIKQPQYTKIY